MEPDIAETFERHRPMLLALARRVLRSSWDAEDVVQDSYLRWARADHAAVREPRAYLITVVTRLALDQLRSARVSRTVDVARGRLEPAADPDPSPLDVAELLDGVTFATAVLMERLSPPERAVFLLREAFDLPYEEIVGVAAISVPACRQTLVRARRRLIDGPDRFRPSRQEHARLLTEFLSAAHGGDLTRLEQLLTDDVSAWSRRPVGRAGVRTDRSAKVAA